MRGECTVNKTARRGGGDGASVALGWHRVVVAHSVDVLQTLKYITYEHVIL